MSPIDLRGDKAGSSRTASGRRRIRALMPGDTKTPLARDAARRHGRGLVFSPEAADGELSGIWDTSGIPEAAVLPSRAIGAVLAIVVVGGPESRLKWHLTKKKKQKEKESTPAATTKCRAALQKLASFFPISRPWSTHCFHGAVRRLNGTHLPLHGCCMSRTLQPKESTGCSPRQGGRRGKIEHAPMPQTRSFFSGDGEPATTLCPDGPARIRGLALSFVCAKIESCLVVWCVWNGRPTSSMHRISNALSES